MLLRRGVRQDHPEERDRDDSQHDQCLERSHALLLRRILVLMLAAQLSKPRSNTRECKFSQVCEAARQLCAVTNYRGMGGSWCKFVPLGRPAPPTYAARRRLV